MISCAIVAINGMDTFSSAKKPMIDFFWPPLGGAEALLA
jgi:hypothetical protein